jgi:hypothetical protein
MGIQEIEWELRKPNGNSESRMGIPKAEREFRKSNRKSEIHLRERVPGTNNCHSAEAEISTRARLRGDLHHRITPVRVTGRDDGASLKRVSASDDAELLDDQWPGNRQTGQLGAMGKEKKNAGAVGKLNREGRSDVDDFVAGRSPRIHCKYAAFNEPAALNLATPDL